MAEDRDAEHAGQSTVARLRRLKESRPGFQATENSFFHGTTQNVEAQPAVSGQLSGGLRPLLIMRFFEVVWLHFFGWLFLHMLVPGTGGGLRAATILVVCTALPALLGLALAANSADRIGRNKLLVRCKSLDGMVMIVAVTIFVRAGLAARTDTLAVVITALALGSVYAVSRTTRIAIIPDLVDENRVVAANHQLLMVMMAGTTAGFALTNFVYSIWFGQLQRLLAFDGRIASTIAVAPVLLAAALISSRNIGRVQPVFSKAAVGGRLGKRLVEACRLITTDAGLLRATWGMAALGGFASMFAAHQLSGSTFILAWLGLVVVITDGTILLAAAALGVCVGPLFGGLLSAGRNSAPHVAPTVLLCACIYTLLRDDTLNYLLSSSIGFWALCVLMFLYGAGAAMYYLPLEAERQLRVPAELRSSAIAIGNAITATAVLLGWGFYFLLRDVVGLSSTWLAVVVLLSAGLLQVPVIGLENSPGRRHTSR